MSYEDEDQDAIKRNAWKKSKQFQDIKNAQERGSIEEISREDMLK